MDTADAKLRGVSELVPEGVKRQMDGWEKFRGELEPGEEYLNRTEKLLYRRLWEYIIGEDWEGVGQVVTALHSLTLI